MRHEAARRALVALLLQMTIGALASCPAHPAGLRVVPLVRASNPGDSFVSLGHRVLHGDRLELTVYTNVKGWVGVGFSETGHMLGSDFFVVNRRSDSTEAFEVTDYAMYWTAWPLLNATTQLPVEPAPVPHRDYVQDWSIACAAVNAEGRIAVTVVRALDTGDVHEDRAVVNGSMHVIFAWAADLVSRELLYHSPAHRGNTQINFLGEPAPKYKVPADADGHFDAVLSGFVSTMLPTQYVCQSFDLGAPTRHLVAFEPVVRGVPGASLVHHMNVYLCGNAADQPPLTTNRPGADATACGFADVLHRGGSPMFASACRVLAFAWAVGGDELAMPNVAGVAVGGGSPSRYLVLEVHVSNPAGLASQPVRTGVRLRTASRLRLFNATTLLIGDVTLRGFARDPTADFGSRAYGASSVRLPLRQSEAWFEANCPSTCTRTLRGPLFVAASYLHMHYTGRSIFTTRTRGRDTVVTTATAFWNAGFQGRRTLDYTIMPGDSLSTHCAYDTSKLGDAPPRWGTDSSDEMCVEFLTVFPAENIVNLARCGVAHWRALVGPATPASFNLSTFMGQRVNVSWCELGGDRDRLVFADTDGWRVLPHVFRKPPPPTAGAPTAGFIVAWTVASCIGGALWRCSVRARQSYRLVIA